MTNKERPKFGTAQIECGKRSCKWAGTERDLKQEPHKTFSNCMQNVCPQCGCDSYYIIRDKK